MYSNPKTGDSLMLFGGLGIVSFASSAIAVIIIFGVFLTLFSLLSKRFALEPVHHPSGEYRWAFTKNGNPLIWLKKKRKP